MGFQDRKVNHRKVNRFYPFLLLLAGFGLGWLSAQRWADGSVPTQDREPHDPLVAMVQPIMAQPVPDSANLVLALEQDNVDTVVRYLQNPGGQTAPAPQLRQTLDRFLRQLQAEGHWPRLRHWLQALLLAEPDNALWQDLMISTYRGLQQPRAALKLLFEAYAGSLDPLRRQQLMRRIETLLSEQLDWHRQQTPTRLSANPDLMGLLQFALEKQPEHAAFGLMLAEVYEQSGDLEQALTQLQWIPYSESHQAQVEESRLRVERKLSQQQRAQEGIALHSVMGQFVVRVVFDEAVALDLMIDTGATVTALSREAVATLHQYGVLQDTQQQVQVNTANGVVMSPLYQVGRMRVGDWEMRDVELLQVNLGSQEVDGLLGMNFLGQFAFSIDQQQALLYLDSK